MSAIEWEYPPGSGRRANYSPVEATEMRDLIRRKEDGEITAGEFDAIIGLIHDAKVDADAKVQPTPADEVEPPVEYEPSELFPIPEGIQQRLAARSTRGEPDPLASEHFELPPPEPPPVRFDELPNGWLATTPPARMVKAAIARQEHGDAVKPNKLDNYAALSVRAEGFVAEAILDAWLTQQEADFTHHGGTDYLPDFVVYGQPVAVRCCGSLTPFTSSHRVYVFDTHLASAPQRFFAGCERKTGNYILLGGCSTDAFKEQATYAEKGTEVVRGFIASYPLWHAPVSCLTLPAPWVASLR